MRIDDGRLHYSRLKLMDRSPMHFALDEFADSDAYAWGRAFHVAVLLGKTPKFWEGKRQGNAYNEAVASNGGEIIITATAYDEVMRAVESVRKSRLAQELLSRCPNRETYHQWERDGVKCAGTIDADGPGTVVELKSCRSANPYRFRKEASWYLYPEQKAWYQEPLGGVFRGPDSELLDSYIIACEKKYPFAVSCIRVTPLRLIDANERCAEWLEKYKESTRLNYWPGWDQSCWDLDCDIDVAGSEDND